MSNVIRLAVCCHGWDGERTQGELTGDCVQDSKREIRNVEMKRMGKSLKCGKDQEGLVCLFNMVLVGKKRIQV